jgi:hypothetical protein
MLFGTVIAAAVVILGVLIWRHLIGLKRYKQVLLEKWNEECLIMIKWKRWYDSLESSVRERVKYYNNETFQDHWKMQHEYAASYIRMGGSEEEVNFFAKYAKEWGK